MVNEYAALLAPDPRQYYHYFAVLPAVDTIQLLNDKVRSALCPQQPDAYAGASNQGAVPGRQLTIKPSPNK